MLLICISLITDEIWASFYMLIGILNFFFCEVSVQVFCSFIYLSVVFLMTYRRDFRSIIHLKLMLRRSPVSYFFTTRYSVFLIPFIERTILSPLLWIAGFVINWYTYTCASISGLSVMSLFYLTTYVSIHTVLITVTSLNI